MFGFQPYKHGLFVIDVDEGYNVLQYAIADGILPKPMVVRRTGSGGYHVFYRITKEEVAKLASPNGKYEFTHYDTTISGEFRYSNYVAVHPSETVGDNAWPNDNGARELARDLDRAEDKHISADVLLSIATAGKAKSKAKTPSATSSTVQAYTIEGKHSWTSEYNEGDNKRFAVLAIEKNGYVDNAIKHLNADTDYSTWMQTCSLLFQIADYDKRILRKVQAWCKTSRNVKHIDGVEQVAALYTRNKALNERERLCVPIRAARRLEWVVRNNGKFSSHMGRQQKTTALRELKKHRTAAIAGYDVKQWVAENCLKTTVPHTDRAFMVKQPALYTAYRNTTPNKKAVSARRFHREMRYMGFTTKRFTTYGFNYYSNFVQLGASKVLCGDMRYSKIRNLFDRLSEYSFKSRVENTLSTFFRKLCNTEVNLSFSSYLYYINSEDRKRVMGDIADTVSYILECIQRNALEPNKRFVLVPNKCYSF